MTMKEFVWVGMGAILFGILAGMGVYGSYYLPVIAEGPVTSGYSLHV